MELNLQRDGYTRPEGLGIGHKEAQPTIRSCGFGAENPSVNESNTIINNGEGFGPPRAERC